MDLMDYRRKIIMSSPHLSHAEGAVATFSDGTDLPLKSLVVQIDPVQDLHGQDAPYPAGGGKNKLDPSLLKDQAAWNTIELSVKPNTSYIASTNKPQSVGLYTYFNNTGTAGGGSSTEVYNGHPVTVTSTADGKVYFSQRRAAGTDSFQNYHFQIEEGSTATDYAPYENICPISGWSAANVTGTGKNLWSPTSSYPVSGWDVTWSRNADGSIHVQGTATGQANNYAIASNGMSVDAGTYTISVRTTDPNIHFIFGGGGNTAGIAYTDMVDGSTKTFTTSGGTTGHNIVRVNSGATVNGDIYIQLEKGSTVTPYEPYTGTSVTISLGQTVYEGTLNPLTGELVVEWVGVDGGDVTWTKSSSYQYGKFSFSASDSLFDNTGYNVISSSYKAESNDGASATGDMYVWVWSTHRIHVKDSSKDALTAAEFQTAMTGIMFVYKLAQPLTYQLDPQTVRSLVGQNNIFADTGNVALDYWAHP